MSNRQRMQSDNPLFGQVNPEMASRRGNGGEPVSPATAVAASSTSSSTAHASAAAPPPAVVVTDAMRKEARNSARNAFKRKWNKWSEEDKVEATDGVTEVIVEREAAKAGESAAKADLAARDAAGIFVAIETNLKQLFMNGMVVPSSINRRVADVKFRSAAPEELAASSHASSKRSSTSIPHNHYCPVGVVDWESWHTDLEQFKFEVKRLKNVEMHVKSLVQNPIDKRDMASNWFKVFSVLGRACHAAGLVTYDLVPERVVRDDNSVKAKPDITIGIFESVGKKGQGEIFRPIFPSEAKAVDKWPALPNDPSRSRTISLPDLWKIKPRSAKYSHEQMAIVQLVTQMCTIKRSYGSLFNGFSAYFCKLDKEGVLHAAGPYDMTSSIFFQTFVSFVKFSFAQDTWSEVPKVLKAAATGAHDDDMDRTGDGEDIGVEVPGPGLGREYDCENYQILLNKGAEGRPQVWLRRIGVEAEEGETVAVKAVDHDMDHDGSLRSELVNEINVYQRLENSGTHDFIPEFVSSGKLPGGDRSAIVTKFAGGGIDMWKPKDKAEALDVQRKAQDALTSLHDHGFMHGDVALRNFVMDEDNRKVRVIDLGRSYEVNEVSKPEIEIEALKSEFRSSFPQFFDE